MDGTLENPDPMGGVGGIPAHSRGWNGMRFRSLPTQAIPGFCDPEMLGLSADFQPFLLHISRDTAVGEHFVSPATPELADFFPKSHSAPGFSPIQSKHSIPKITYLTASRVS